MATLMYNAAQTEDTTTQQSQERLSQLEYENKYLREVLSLSSSAIPNPNGESKKPLVNSEMQQQSALSSQRDSSSDSDDSRCSTPKVETIGSV